VILLDWLLLETLLLLAVILLDWLLLLDAVVTLDAMAAWGSKTRPRRWATARLTTCNNSGVILLTQLQLS